jgi:hypothetical protein
MSTADIRHKLVEYIRFANDKKVKAIYVILENEIEEKHEEWTKEFEDEILRRIENFESGKDKGVSRKEVTKKVAALAKKR